MRRRSVWVVECRGSREGKWRLLGASILSSVFDTRLTALTAAAGARRYGRDNSLGWQYRVVRYDASK